MTQLHLDSTYNRLIAKVWLIHPCVSKQIQLADPKVTRFLSENTSPHFLETPGFDKLLTLQNSHTWWLSLKTIVMFWLIITEERKRNEDKINLFCWFGHVNTKQKWYLQDHMTVVCKHKRGLCPIWALVTQPRLEDKAVSQDESLWITQWNWNTQKNMEEFLKTFFLLIHLINKRFHGLLLNV